MNAVHKSGALWLSVVLVAAVLLLAGASIHAQQTVPATTNLLKDVHSFMYQLQGIEEPASIERLANSPYDLLIVEPAFTIKGNERFDVAAMVARLKAGKPGRLVVAYVDIGEAERFRVYWDKSWKRPTKNGRGSPAFLLAPDPDGWKDDVSVAFWAPQWQSLWVGESGLVQQVMRAGFDGLYLDWVEAYSEKRVAAEARRQGVAPIKAMVDFIGAIRKQARQAQPRAVVIAQNAPDLIDADPRYASLIDGVGFEDTWFSGKADAGWEIPKAATSPTIAPTTTRPLPASSSIRSSSKPASRCSRLITV
jgi:cysteinyl-tRNA synthetase, unknown class